MSAKNYELFFSQFNKRPAPVSDVAPTPLVIKKPKVQVTEQTIGCVKDDMKKFLTDYFQEYSFPMYVRTSLLPVLKSTFAKKPNAPANLTAFSGGTFYVPPDRMADYFRLRTVDIQTKRYSGMNEQSCDGDRALLALEIDYRFTDIKQVTPREILMEHINAILATVVKYIPDRSLRMFLYDSHVKPKYSNGKWIIALGFHLLFNRRVRIEMGAQISHAAALALKRFDVSSVLDNVYIKSRSGKLCDVVQLRPPYSAKKIVCYFCNDPVFKTSKDIQELQGTFKPACKICDSEKYCLDINMYNLVNVYNPDFSVDEEYTNTFRTNLMKELTQTSIWGLAHPFADVKVPEGMPTYTLFEMAGKVPEGTSKVKARQMIKTEKPADVQKRLISFGCMNVKRKDSKGFDVKITPEINNAVRKLLEVIHDRYRLATVSKITKYIHRNKDDGSINLQLTGEGSTYCMVKEEDHSSNRTQIWISLGKVFCGCWSDHCPSLYRKVPDFRDPSIISRLLTLCFSSPTIVKTPRQSKLALPVPIPLPRPT